MRDRARGLPISRAGVIARAALGIDGEAEVIAAFDRSFYVACPRGIVCIGVPSIGSGPINVEVVSLAGRDLVQLGIGSGLEGRIEDGTLVLGDVLSLDVASGETWHPPPLPVWRPDHVRAGLAAVRTAAIPLLPSDGLAVLVLSTRLTHEPGPSPESAMAAEPVRAIEAALPLALSDNRWPEPAVRAATLLLGLGPGATPSGDDFLGGVMLALTAADRSDLKDALWYALEPELDMLTTPLSAMHLAAAADGMALAPVHALLEAISSGEDMKVTSALPAVAAIGHTSGWDALAGIALGLAALSNDTTNG